MAPINESYNDESMSPKAAKNIRFPNLRITSKASYSVFIPFLVFHFFCVSPVTNYLCFCPQNDVSWECSCNCSKCSKRRLTSILSAPPSPAHGSHRDYHFSTGSQTNKVTHWAKHREMMPVDVTTAAGTCSCRHQDNDLSKDVKQFIPILVAAEFTTSPDKIIYPTVNRLITDYFPCPIERPG